MRIALVSTMRTSVPPARTGSVELLVGLLAEELQRRRHHVTVFAPGDSQVTTPVLSVLPRGYHHDETIWDWRLAEFMQLGVAYEHAGDFDLIHSHVYCYALPFSRLVDVPTVHTLHICPTPDFVRYARMYPESWHVLVSEFQRGFFEDVAVAGVVHNGIDTQAFPFSATAGPYVAFIGDLRADKGPLEAIRAARTAGIPIRIAGPATEYFQQAIKPELDGRSVEYVGELDHEGKIALLGGALAMIFPGTGLEACPLVLMESMACGTPVVGLSKGPVPEIVVQGVGGIHVPDADSLGPALERVQSLDRAGVRRLAAERFDLSRMVDGYVRIYERALRGRGAWRLEAER
jgi:glycosyltransferase involved in cell wall biosynthesis